MRPADILFAIVIAAVWGLNFVAIKYAVADLPPMTASAIRFAGVALCLSPFLKWKSGQMKALLSVACILGVFHFALMFWAVSIAGGISAIAIAAQLNVPFATILAVLVLGEKVGWRRVSGIGLSFLGVAVIAFEPEVFEYFDGVMVMALAALMYAISLILMRHLRRVPAMTVQAWVALAGMLGAASISFAMEAGQVSAVKSAGSGAWYGVLYTIIGASLIGHGGANVLLRKYEVSKVSPYFLTSPIFSLMGAVFVLGETITLKMYIGALLTVVGILIVTLRNAKVAEEKMETAEDP